MRFFNRPLNFDALFAGGDVFAFQALQALAKKGINVPQEVAVIGIDNTALNMHIMPPLTSVEIQPALEIKSCLKAIISLIDCSKKTVKKQIRVSVVKRESA